MAASSEISHLNRSRHRALLLFYLAAVPCGISAGIVSSRLRLGPDRVGFLCVGIASLAGAVAILALIAFLRSADELQRLIIFRALAFAFVAALILCFLDGLLQIREHLCLPSLAFCVLLVALWSLGLILFSRRYQ